MKKIWKKIGVCMLALLCAGQSVISAHAAETEKGEIFVAFGADLTAEQKTTVMGFFNLTESDLENCHITTVTNAEEHQYLDSYLSSSVIGTKALSSVKVTKNSEGSGINVTTHNINYCTMDMYRNALATAGLSDVDVVVAGPTSISGTAALIGATKVYSEMTGNVVDEKALEAATDELVTTGELSQTLDDPEKAVQFIAYIKQLIIENGYDNPDKIEEAIREAMKEFNINLTDDQVKQLVDMMEKVINTDIDVNTLKNQVQGIYDKLDEMGIDKEEAMGFLEKVWNAILEFFGSFVSSSK